MLAEFVEGSSAAIGGEGVVGAASSGAASGWGSGEPGLFVFWLVSHSTAISPIPALAKNRRRITEKAKSSSRNYTGSHRADELAQPVWGLPNAGGDPHDLATLGRFDHPPLAQINRDVMDSAGAAVV